MYHMAHDVEIGLFDLRGEEVKNDKSNTTVANRLLILLVPDLDIHSALSV